MDQGLVLFSFILFPPAFSRCSDRQKKEEGTAFRDSCFLHLYLPHYKYIYIKCTRALSESLQRTSSRRGRGFFFFPRAFNGPPDSWKVVVRSRGLRSLGINFASLGTDTGHDYARKEKKKDTQEDRIAPNVRDGQNANDAKNANEVSAVCRPCQGYIYETARTCVRIRNRNLHTFHF